MEELPDDLTKTDIPGLPDDKLEELVSRRWGIVDECRECKGSGTVYPPSGPTDCAYCDSRGGYTPSFTSSVTAFGRLVRRIPFGESGAERVERAMHANDRMRAMTEAAAILAVEGVEPREVQS